MPEAFVCACWSSKLKGNSKSTDVSVTPCWQKQQMRVNGIKDRSNGGLAPPVSHRFVMG
jgi:hypothetical protein